MRLLVYGMVLLVGLGVLALRSTGEESPKKSVGTLYAGKTPEGLRTVLSVTDGKVRAAKLKWRMTCENRRPYVSTITWAPEYGDRFEHDGRRFSTGGRAEQGPSKDEFVRYEVSMSGALSPNGNSASGSGRTTETWVRNGREIDRCVSDRVPWTVHRGMPVKS